MLFLIFSKPGQRVETFRVPLQEDFVVIQVEKNAAGSLVQMAMRGRARDFFFLKANDSLGYVFVRKDQLGDLNWKLFHKKFACHELAQDSEFRVTSEGLVGWAQVRAKIEGNVKTRFPRYCLDKFAPWVYEQSPEWQAFQTAVNLADAAPDRFGLFAGYGQEVDLDVLTAAEILRSFKR